MFYVGLAFGGLVLAVIYQAILIFVRDDQRANWEGVKSNLDYVLRCEFLLREAGGKGEQPEILSSRPVITSDLELLAGEWSQNRLLFRGLLSVGKLAARLARYGNKLISILERDDPELSELVNELTGLSNFRVTAPPTAETERLNERSWVLTRQCQNTLRARIAELSRMANFELPRRLEDSIAQYKKGFS